MKKTNRKLIPAVAMLLISAIMLSTSSFAWFSLNREVTANGMEVKAISDATNLQISTVNTGAWDISANAQITGAGTGKLLPVAHEKFEAIGDVTTTAKWYYGYSAASNSAELKEGTKRSLSGVFATATEGYIVKQDFYFRLAAQGDAATNLTVSDVKFAAGAKGMSVIVAGPENFVEFNADTQKDDTILLASVPYVADEATSTAMVTVYLYIDGNQTNVKTDNLPDSITDSVTLKFDAIPATQAPLP